MPVFVAWIAAALSRIFATRLGGWIASAMVFLGLSWGTSAVSLAGVKALVQSQLGSISGDALQWLIFFNIPKYISITLSAYGAAAAVGAGRAFLMRRVGGPSTT